MLSDQILQFVLLDEMNVREGEESLSHQTCRSRLLFPLSETQGPRRSAMSPSVYLAHRPTDADSMLDCSVIIIATTFGAFSFSQWNRDPQLGYGCHPGCPVVVLEQSCCQEDDKQQENNSNDRAAG